MILFFFFSVSCHDEEYCRKGQDLWLSECQVRGLLGLVQSLTFLQAKTNTLK